MLRDVTRQRQVLGVVAFREVEAEPVPRRDRVHVVRRRERPPRGPQHEPVVAQVVIDVGHADEEHHTPPQLLEVVGGVRALLDQETREVEIARAVLPVAAFEHGHRRGKVDAPALVGAIKPPRQERVVSTPEALAARLGGGHSRAHGERVHDALPRPDVVRVSLAGKLRDPQVPLLVEHARLGARAAEGAPRRDQHAQPLAVAAIALGPVALQVKARLFELAERRPWR